MTEHALCHITAALVHFLKKKTVIKDFTVTAEISYLISSKVPVINVKEDVCRSQWVQFKRTGRLMTS